MFGSKHQPLTREKGVRLLDKPKNPDQSEVSRQHVKVIDLKGISLRGTNLRYAHLTGADLSSPSLQEGNRDDRWYCVRFNGADLREARVDLSYIDKAGLALYT